MTSANENTTSATTGHDELALGPGSIVDERYELVERLGTGGFGTVFRARHLQLDRPVAVKLLHPRFIEDSEAVKRFQQEAQAVSLMDHPHVIKVFSFGVSAGIPYMATELLAGETLFEVVQQNERLQPMRAIPIFLQICQGLQHAHERGIIHRDLKPSNVMLIDRDGQRDFAKVLDFGFAKVSPDAGLNLQSLTHTGSVVGDPLYMSPEQCRAQPLDARSDIYSMGCLMYEALAGAPPFEADNAVSLMFKRLIVEPPPFADKNKSITGGLEDIVLRAMEREPERRFQTAQELGEALQAELEAINQGTAKRASDKPRRRQRSIGYRVAMITIMAVCPVVLAGTLWLMTGGRLGDTDDGAISGRIDVATASSAALRALSADMLRAGEFGEAKLMAEQAVSRARRENRRASMIAAHDQLFHVHAATANVKECLKDLEDSLELRRRMFGENTAAEATTLGQIGDLYFVMGELKKAPPYLESLVANDQAFLALSVNARLRVLDELCSTYLAAEKYDDAERTIHRFETHVMQTPNAPADAEVAAKVLWSRLRSRQDKLKEANTMLDEALVLASKPGMDSFVKNRVLRYKAVVAEDHGQDRRAADLKKLAWAVPLGEGEPAVYYAGFDARMSSAHRVHSAAYTCFKRALSIYEECPEKFDPDSEILFCNYAETLRALKREGEISAAVAWYRKIVKGRAPTT